MSKKSPADFAGLFFLNIHFFEGNITERPTKFVL